MLIQVVCTLAIFGFWWSKPLDVNEPIEIKILKSPDDRKSRYYPPLKNKSPEELVQLEHGTFPHQDKHPLKRHCIVKRSAPNPISIIAKGCYDIIIYIDPRLNDRVWKKVTDPEANGGDTSIDPWVKDDVRNQVIEMEGDAGPPRLTGYTLPRITKKRVPMHMVAEGMIVGVIGGLHAAAWNVHFPTRPEQILWQLSSLGMCVFPLWVVFILLCTSYQEDLIDTIWEVHLVRFKVGQFLIGVIVKIHAVARKHAKNTALSLRYPTHLFFILHCLGCLLVYLYCVVFVTVESYASVRDPPVGTMDTPVWSTYWPHL